MKSLIASVRAGIVLAAFALVFGGCLASPSAQPFQPYRAPNAYHPVPLAPSPTPQAFVSGYRNPHGNFLGPCTRPGQLGCFELRIMKFEAYARDQRIRAVVDEMMDNMISPVEGANILYWQGLKHNKVRWKEGCREYLVITWGVNNLPLPAFRSYEGTRMEPATWDGPRKTATLHKALGPPTHVFLEKLCLGQGGLQFPNGYFRKGQSWMMICPLGEKTVYPEQPVDWRSIDRQGIWFGPEQIDEYIEGNYTSARVAFLY